MIRYRPHRCSLSASLKDEKIFDSVEDAISHILEYWGRVVAFMGAKNPLTRGDIFISAASHRNPMIGYKNEHKVFISRMTDSVFRVPLCIGYIEMEAFS